MNTTAILEKTKYTKEDIEEAKKIIARGKELEDEPEENTDNDEAKN